MPQVHPSLRVFGLVVRRRPCRTRPAADARALWIHRLKPARGEEGFLQDLRAALAPDLDARLWRADRFALPERARLRFRTHDLALRAWRRLAESPFGPDLSWTTAPPDAKQQGPGGEDAWEEWDDDDGG